ncbi:MAG: hypothetical protein QOF56_1028 [Acidobacteriaceae bacterium]|nr:hypothetical protein [Acidobacteriaceae bacterium]
MSIPAGRPHRPFLARSPWRISQRTLAFNKINELRSIPIAALHVSFASTPGLKNTSKEATRIVRAPLDPLNG